MVVARGRRRVAERSFPGGAAGPAPRAERPALPPPPVPAGDPVGGVVVLDRGGTLLHADRGATALLAATPGVSTRIGQHAMLHARGAPGRPSDVSLPLPDGGRLRLLLFPVLGDVGELFGMLSASPPPGGTLPTVLSPRETQVIDLLRQGHPLRDVARHLGLSRDTIRWHVRNAKEKGVVVELP